MEIKICLDLDREKFLKAVTEVAKHKLLSSDDYESELLAQAQNMMAFHLSHRLSPIERDKHDEFRSYRKDWENGVRNEIVQTVKDYNCFILSVVQEAVELAIKEVQHRISVGGKGKGN